MWGMEKIRDLSNLQKYYVASSLRTEIVSFQDLLKAIEDSERCEAYHIRESLKILERNLRSLNHSLANYN